MCALDLPGDYIFIRMHSNRPTVHSIYIFDTVQNAFQLVDFTRQHYFERALLDSGLMHGNILATNNLFSELHCSCQTGKLKSEPGSGAWYWRRYSNLVSLGMGSFTTTALPDWVKHWLMLGRVWSMRGEQRRGAMLQLIACSQKRCLSLFCSRSSLPCPQGGQKNSAEWRLELSSGGM